MVRSARTNFFIFAGFEEQRYLVGGTNPIIIPTSAVGSPQVSIPVAEAALAANHIPLNALSLKLLPFFGTTNDPGGNVVTNFPTTNKSDNVLAKIDYTLNSHNTLSGTYFLGDDNNISQDDPRVTQAAFLSTFHIRVQTATAHWVWTPNTNWANEARFGFVRYNRPVESVDHNVPASQYGINTGVTNPVVGGMPNITVGGAQLGAFPQWPSLLGPDNNFDWLDQVSYTHGTHAFKFGGEVRHATIYSAGYSNGRGTFTFGGGQAFKATATTSASTALEDFLAGDPTRGKLTFGNPVRNYRTDAYAGFAQDDWRIKPRVTLNIGVRWEYSAPISEANNLIANFVPGTPTGLEQVGQGLSTAYNRDKTNFAPRFGVAWDISGNGTTVIRAGGGLFYEMLQVGIFTGDPGLASAPASGVGALPTAAKFVEPNGTVVQGGGNISTGAFTYNAPQLNWTLAGPVFPANTAAGVTCGSGGATGSPCPLYVVSPNLTTPMVGIWTLSLQHAFSPGLSLEAAYVGNHGDNLTGVEDINSIDPTSPAEVACGHCEASIDRPYGAEYPWFSFINVVKNPYRSNYDALQATLTARNFHTLSFVAGYTYSHSLDDMSYSAFNYIAENPRNLAPQYGDGDFDIRHRFTLTTTWNVPGKKGMGQLLEGWVVNSIVTIQTPAPWIEYDTSNDIDGTGENQDRWDFFGNPSDFQSGPTPLPYFAGTSNPACVTAEGKVANGPGGTTGLQSLANFGCYQKGSSVLVPPAVGTFGTTGRNVFRDSGFRKLGRLRFQNFYVQGTADSAIPGGILQRAESPEFCEPIFQHQPERRGWSSRSIAAGAIRMRMRDS